MVVDESEISCVRKKTYRYPPSFASYNEQTSASTDHQLPIAFYNLFYFVHINLFPKFKDCFFKDPLLCSTLEAELVSSINLIQVHLKISSCTLQNSASHYRRHQQHKGTKNIFSISQEIMAQQYGFWHRNCCRAYANQDMHAL